MRRRDPDSIMEIPTIGGPRGALPPADAVGKMNNVRKATIKSYECLVHKMSPGSLSFFRECTSRLFTTKCELECSSLLVHNHIGFLGGFSPLDWIKLSPGVHATLHSRWTIQQISLHSYSCTTTFLNVHLLKFLKYIYPQHGLSRLLSGLPPTIHATSENRISDEDRRGSRRPMGINRLSTQMYYSMHKMLLRYKRTYRIYRIRPPTQYCRCLSAVAYSVNRGGLRKLGGGKGGAHSSVQICFRSHARNRLTSTLLILALVWLYRFHYSTPESS